MERIIPSSDLRNHYNEIAEGCRTNREVVVLTRNGREDTVLMSCADYRMMKAERELMLMLAEADEDIRAGRVMPMEDAFAAARDVLRKRWPK